MSKIMTNGKPLFIFEMANNHMGDVHHGLRIIDAIAEQSAHFDFSFAFKFQYRNLETFIHPEYAGRQDIKYVKRFSETRLSDANFRVLKHRVQSHGFLSICTAFDEPSVDLIEEHQFDIIKIASCSFTDWPLLERIVRTNLPIIASTAGVSLEDMDQVMGFFRNRNKAISVMHCVAEYPTQPQHLQMNQIDFLLKRFPNTRIGFSTHEDPDNMLPIRIAIAKGATIFEKHVGVPTEQFPLNAYSASPEQVHQWLSTAQETYTICGVENERKSFSEKEAQDLRGLRRGVFVKQDVAEGEMLDINKIFLAIPVQENQITANDLPKYTKYKMLRGITKNQPVLVGDTEKSDMRKEVIDIVRRVTSLIMESKVHVPNNLDLELSHHYGMKNFYETGCTIINFINRVYCKKIIILLPNQTHPEQYHKVKEETFHILHGRMEVTLDGVSAEYKVGDMILVEKGVKHIMHTDTGVLFEEISSTHYNNDSFYSDEDIARNKDRKTFITAWLNV